MKKLKLTFLSGLLFFSCNLFAETPGGITKPSVWLKGNFSSDAGRMASLNFNPAVALDKSDTRIKLQDNLEPLRRVTIFTVYMDDAANKEKTVWEMTGEFGDLSLSTNQVSSKSRKTNIGFNKNKAATGASSDRARANVIIHTYSSNNAGGSASKNPEYKESSILFGKTGSQESVDGSLKLVSEFILYKRLLNEQETAKIETYLALKYGITLEKNYLNAKNETVWNRDDDNGFSNNIAGIGRDDQSSLLQKQSTSGGSAEQLVIGVNKIVQSNNENVGEINDGDYLVWGDNAEECTRYKVQSTQYSDIMLSEKKWLMKASGTSSNKISTELKIDTKKFLKLESRNWNGLNFYLVIDRTASADFRPENCRYIVADNISTDGIATFSNVVWDTDGSGRDNFTFGFKPDLQRTALNPKSTDNGLLSFNVYPNPVSDGNYQLAINFDKPTDIQINIYDLSHQLISSKTVSGQTSYQLSGHIDGPSAAYIIQLVTHETEFYRIIILQ